MKHLFLRSLLIVAPLNCLLFFVALLMVGPEKALFLALFASICNLLTILKSPERDIFAGLRLIPRATLAFVFVIVIFTSFLPIGKFILVERITGAILGLNFLIFGCVLIAARNAKRPLSTNPGSEK